MSHRRNNPSVLSQDTGNSRQAEKDHVGRLESTEWLLSKPFLAGTSHSVDRAVLDIASFAAVVHSLPHGPGARILDLGAGSCWVSEWLQKLGFRTCSLDLSRDMLALGRQRLADPRALCVGDMVDLPFRDETFEAAVCYGALHHVPEWREALTEIHRVLRDGGVLVLQEPGRGHHAHPESVAQMQRFGTLEQELPPRALARACRAAGFDRVIVRPILTWFSGSDRIRPPYPFWRHAPRLYLLKRLLRLKTALIEWILNAVFHNHLVVAVKGEAWADSRRPDTLVCRFRDLSLAPKAVAGQPIPVRAGILNTGMTRWLSDTGVTGVGQVRLGVSLLDEDGKIVAMDYARLALPHDVLPGEAIELEGDLPPIETSGKYVLKFDLVSEGVDWFEARGSRPVLNRIHVSPEADEA